MEKIQTWAIALMILTTLSEAVVSFIHNMKLFDLKDSAVNIVLGIFTIVVSLLMKGVTLKLFLSMQQYSFTEIEFSWGVAVALFLISDFYYYWFHRLAHGCRFVWASHVVHHSSEKFNLTVAIRLPFTNGFYRFLFWSPLCLLGFPPLMVILMDTMVVYYTFFIHTETIGKLGWLERILNTPSHHRVHHSNNPGYIDKNFGGVFILWDRIFGTYVKETDKPIYGITKPFRSYDPVKIICDEWICMYRDLRDAQGISEMIKIVFGHPAWKRGGRKNGGCLSENSQQHTRSVHAHGKKRSADPGSASVALVVILALSFPASLFAQYNSLDSEPKVSLKVSHHIYDNEINDFSIFSIGAEWPVGKEYAFEAQLGKIVNGNFYLESALGNENYTGFNTLSTNALNFSLDAGIKYYKKGNMAKSSFYYLLQMNYQSARFDGYHSAAKDWTYNDAQDWLSLIFGLDPYWYPSTQQTNYYQATSSVLSFTLNCGYRAIAAQRVTFDIYGGLGPSLNTTKLENFDWGVPEPSRPGYDGEVVTGTSPEQTFSGKRFHMALECGIKLGYLIY